MKYIITSFFLLFFCRNVLADTIMLIHPKGGGEATRVQLVDKPVATYEDNVLVITTSSATLRFALSDIEHVSFADSEDTSVEPITISNLDAGENRVYDLQGKLVKVFPVGESVTISALSSGIYIIKNNLTTYKIQKR